MELRLEGLGKNYGKFCALKDINLTMKPGIYGLLGPNGAGKSTMMNIIAGVLKPSAGRITLDGMDAAKAGMEYRLRLGYLPQAVGFYGNFTASEFLRYMASLQKMKSGNRIDERIKWLLEQVNLSDVAHKKISGFSGGMKQRLGIAQVFLHNPDVVILDEPTAGLDPKERIRFRNLISPMASDKIIILATHIVSDVENLADELLIMKQGNLVQTGTLSECLSVVDGRIYNVHVPESELLHICERYQVTSIKAKGEDSVVRIVTDEPPEGAVLLDHSTLEDLYLYYFGA